MIATPSLTSAVIFLPSTKTVTLPVALSPTTTLIVPLPKSTTVTSQSTLPSLTVKLPTIKVSVKLSSPEYLTT